MVQCHMPGAIVLICCSVFKCIVIQDFHNVFIDEGKVSKPLM